MTCNRKLVWAGWGLLVLAGCAPMTRSAETPSLDATAWVLTALAGRAPVGSTPTVSFESGRIQGTDGCNRYGAGYSTHGSTIEVGRRMATTEMACDPAVMQQAQAFVAALIEARSYRVVDGKLQLLDANGTVRASFAAQSRSLADTSWRATGINNGKGAVASLAPDTTVTLNFSADGRLSGSGGCNNYSAGYQVDGNQIRFTPAAATRRMCVAAGVMEQEQAFFDALASVATVRREADRMEMRTAEGAIALLLVRAAPQ